MQSNTYEILPALPPLKADSKRKPGPKLVHSKVLQDNVGRVPQPLQRKRKVYTELNARLKTLCERYSNGYYDNIAPIEPHIGTFLDKIAHNLQQTRF